MSNPRDTITRATQAIEKHSRQLVHVPGGLAMCLLVLDRSGSMHVHGDTPRGAVNELIQTLRGAPGTDSTLLALFTFNEETTLDLPPVLASRATELSQYRADGNTALYQAVYAALSIAMEFHKRETHKGNPNARVAISVISDGADTCSPTGAQSERELAAQGLKLGFDLRAIGLGIDAQRLAQLLGFQPELAHQTEASQAGVRDALKRVTRSFSTTMVGGPNKK